MKACEEHGFVRDHAKKAHSSRDHNVEARARSERFTLVGFLERLVRWIAVDDQVSDPHPMDNSLTTCPSPVHQCS